MTIVDSTGTNEEQSFSSLLCIPSFLLGWAAQHHLIYPGPGPAGARVWGEVTSQGAGSIRHEEHFVQQPAASSRQLREGCGFQFIKQQIIPRLRVRHRRTRYLARGEKKRPKKAGLIFN